MSIPYTNADHVLLKVARDLFNSLYERRLLVRLVGIRFTNLIPGHYQISLFDDTEQLINLYQAIDSVKHRFGEEFVKRARGVGRPRLIVPI